MLSRRLFHEARAEPENSHPTSIFEPNSLDECKWQRMALYSGELPLSLDLRWPAANPINFDEIESRRGAQLTHTASWNIHHRAPLRAHTYAPNVIEATADHHCSVCVHTGEIIICCTKAQNLFPPRVNASAIGGIDEWLNVVRINKQVLLLGFIRLVDSRVIGPWGRREECGSPTLYFTLY